MTEVLEQHLIPTDHQRETLLTEILATGALPGVYALCDLLGWLRDQDRTADHTAILEALNEPAWWDRPTANRVANKRSVAAACSA